MEHKIIIPISLLARYLGSATSWWIAESGITPDEKENPIEATFFADDFSSAENNDELFILGIGLFLLSNVPDKTLIEFNRSHSEWTEDEMKYLIRSMRRHLPFREEDLSPFLEHSQLVSDISLEKWRKLDKPKILEALPQEFRRH